MRADVPAVGNASPFTEGRLNGFKSMRSEVWRDTDRNRTGREALSDVMSSYWTQFAYTGDPGRGRDETLPPWHAWDPAEGGPKTMVFDTEHDGGVRMTSEPLTRASLLAKLAGDPRMNDAMRCELFAEYVKRDTLAATDRAASGCSEEGLASVAAR